MKKLELINITKLTISINDGPSVLDNYIKDIVKNQNEIIDWIDRHEYRRELIKDMAKDLKLSQSELPKCATENGELG